VTAKPVTAKQILRHHRDLHGQLRRRAVPSKVLGVRRPYYVYTPPQRGGARAGCPLLVLLRGHEREWANPEEDASRRSTAIQDLDRLIARGVVPPMMAVLPGICSADNRIHSCGIDMEGVWPERRTLGTGRFWTHLTTELLPHVERRHRVRVGTRLVVGFSLGGFLAYLWGVRRPRTFDHVAVYDGTLPWPRHNDPREDGGAFCDPLFGEAAIFTPAFGAPPRRATLRRWNPTDDLRTAEASRLRSLEATTFWIASAARDGSAGNRDRACFVARLLREHGIPLGFPNEVVLDKEAAHTFAWADRFLVRILRGVFGNNAPGR
jgi:enterochelin esterase-like enzyme